MFFIQRKWIPHESPINMLCGYEDIESVQLYGNVFVWNISSQGARGNPNGSRCNLYDIETGIRETWNTHTSDDAHIPVFGVDESLFKQEMLAKYDTRNIQWYLGDDMWMQKGKRWYGYGLPINDDPYVYTFIDRARPWSGSIMPIKMGYNAWSIISSETQQILRLIGYRKASYSGACVSDTLSFKDHIVDLTSDQEKGIVTLKIYNRLGEKYSNRGPRLTFEQFLIQTIYDEI